MRLRGHHFLCMLTYKGLGYSPAFVANMDRVVDRIGQGVPVQVVTGPDDICGGMTDACRAASGHDCAKADTLGLDLLAQGQVSDLLGRDLNGAVSHIEISRLRTAFHTNEIRAGCVGCPWHQTCDQIADNGFQDVRL